MTRSMRTPGPIATKLINKLRKSKQNKLIDLEALRLTKEELIELKQSSDCADIDPMHAMFANTQHRIVDFFELVSVLPMFDKFCSRHESAEDYYMPSGPPMSPVTGSFFNCWFLFDMMVGVKKETVTSLMIDCMRAFKGDHDFLCILEVMQSSHNGLYIHEGSEDQFVYLRDIFTDELHKTLVPAGYIGEPGQIWLVRLFPDPFGDRFDYSLAFTTPYVIVQTSSSQPDVPLKITYYPKEEWANFIERNLSTSESSKQNAYDQFMKYGLDAHYWMEYVTLAYVNHTSEMILLTGFPDQPESLPHYSDESASMIFTH